MATPSLETILLAPERRPLVVADLVRMVTAEVAEKKGASGLALKAGYSTIRRTRRGFIPNAINRMLPNATKRLDRYYEEYDPTRHGSLTDYLVANSSAVADLLLGVADSGARRTRVESARKLYTKMRPQAKKHVEQAMPRLGEVLQRHITEAAAEERRLRWAGDDREA